MTRFTAEQKQWITIYKHWKEARVRLESDPVHKSYDLEEGQVVECLQRRGVSQAEADAYLKAQKDR